MTYASRTYEQCVATLRTQGFIRNGESWWRPGDDQTATVDEVLPDTDQWTIVYLKD